jgi:SAM-dependent methyltransferase
LAARVDRGEQPLDENSDRTRLLYRIPAVSNRGRALDLTVGGKSLPLDGFWSGGLVEFEASGWRAGENLPFPDGSFDVVVLHRTLDRLAAIATREGRPLAIHDFLSQVARVLSGGGLIIGCVENRPSLDRALDRVKRLFGKASSVSASDSRRLTVRQCDRALAAAGFADIMLFNLLHGPDTPSRLLSIERGWSRRACKRHLEGLRGLVGPFSFATWRVLAEFGVSQYLGSATFFWGRKSC